MTASPYRADNDEFNSFKNNFNVTFQITDKNENDVTSPIQYLIEREYLSSIKYHILSNSEGNVSKNEYYKTLHDAVLFECSEIIKRNENTIIFAQSKSHAIALSIFLKKNNISR